MAYNPPRHTNPKPAADPLEIDLVYNIMPCGTCQFFWPADEAKQPYGPYPSFDFDSNTPAFKKPAGKETSFPWVSGTTRPPVFPNGEVMDGCRKAPIMTIGINPNLTAFAPGTTGTSWCYPDFTSDNGTDAWTKYAYYYRYRSVYQEHFDLKFVEKFLVKDGEIRAPKDGYVKAADRASNDPSYKVTVRYDGDDKDSTIELKGEFGKPRYVLLFDTVKPNNAFKKGDVLAAKLDVNKIEKVEVYGQTISYYTRFVPVLDDFEKFLKTKGHSASLQVGEDVGQLDMVACASPHWGPPWLGGTDTTERDIVKNCVTKNAWALKQLLQTQPAVLYLVGLSSWNMFRDAFGHLVQSKPALPTHPEDGAFTMLRATAEKGETRLKFSTKIDGKKYSLDTRLVIAPHFSYSINYAPQFRMNDVDWESFLHKFAPCATFLNHDDRIAVVAPQKKGYFWAVMINKDADAVLAELKSKYAAAYKWLQPFFYDPYKMLEDVLEDLYKSKEITFTPPKGGNQGFLTRTEGPCQFCVNDHWKFPQGCPYDKPEEKQYPVGFLEKVAAEIISGHEHVVTPTTLAMPMDAAHH